MKNNIAFYALLAPDNFDADMPEETYLGADMPEETYLGADMLEESIFGADMLE